ncbi:MAG: multidrug ABC transporter substrate-binding protein [Chthoniobacterales bacterium]|nr:MAG: multidrug ABC transporter substrate-binding protein [Chthoniobacterales bacterium]
MFSMLFDTIVPEALKALQRNKVRSVLTMLGIIAGVGSFICVVGVGEAGSKRVEEQLHNVGDNLIWLEAGGRARNGVRVGSRGSKTLTLGDWRAIMDEVPAIKSGSPNVDGHIQVVAGNLNWGTQFRGVSPDYFEIRKWTIALGSSFIDEDVDHASTVCVIGETIASNLFGSANPVGESIRVNGVPFKILGVMQPKGFSATGQDQDDFLVVPITTAQKRISGTEWLDDIYFSATRKEDIPEATKRIIALVRERHHLRSSEPDDFNIRTPEELIRAQLASANVFTFLLGSAASLSLLVGGIGIMNIMMVSVTERTREIGIRLAIGATERDIQMQFLSEAIVMSLAGGALGILAGIAGSYFLHSTLHWDIQLSQRIMIIAALFSAGVGVFFGYYPARKASQLDPIEGLRFE